MDDKKLKRINDFLLTQQASVDTISKSRLTQFEKVDDAIQARLSAYQQAEKDLKEATINVSNIASDTGIARKTFYNNDLLRLYVEAYSTQDEEKVATASELERLKAKNEDQAKQIQQFLLRDIETENLRNDKDALLKDTARMADRIQSLEEHIAKLQEENDQLRRDKVIPFPKRK